MNEIIDAYKAEVIKAAPVLVPALVGVIIAGFAWLKNRMSLVRTEITASAVRQAQQLFGDNATAFQAATDELHKVHPKLRPRDVTAAVERAVDKQRASMAPPPRPVVIERPLDDELDEDERDTERVPPPESER